MLDPNTKEQLRTLTVEVILSVRTAYLQTPGANALKNWPLLQERLRAAARTCTNPEELVTKLCRDLQILALGVEASQSLVDLIHEVSERQCASAWLTLVDDEIGYLMALARLTAETRRETKLPTKSKKEVA